MNTRNTTITRNSWRMRRKWIPDVDCDVTIGTHFTIATIKKTVVGCIADRQSAGGSRNPLSNEIDHSVNGRRANGTEPQSARPLSTEFYTSTAYICAHNSPSLVRSFVRVALPQLLIYKYVYFPCWLPSDATADEWLICFVLSPSPLSSNDSP